MATGGRGYFGIAVEHGKCAANLGSLWRSADLFGAAFIATIGRRYQRQSSDTMKTWRNTPLWNFDSLDELCRVAPLECLIVGVELTDDAIPLERVKHPQRCIYVLGAGDHGLTKDTLRRCHVVTKLPGRMSMNVAVAGGIVLYDRAARGFLEVPA